VSRPPAGRLASRCPASAISSGMLLTLRAALGMDAGAPEPGAGVGGLQLRRKCRPGCEQAGSLALVTSVMDLHVRIALQEADSEKRPPERWRQILLGVATFLVLTPRCWVSCFWCSGLHQGVAGPWIQAVLPWWRVDLVIAGLMLALAAKLAQKALTAPDRTGPSLATTRAIFGAEPDQLQVPSCRRSPRMSVLHTSGNRCHRFAHRNPAGSPSSQGAGEFSVVCAQASHRVQPSSVLYPWQPRSGHRGLRDP